MKQFFVKVLLTAAAVVALHVGILLFIRVPLPAEYWIREVSIVKRYQAEQLPSPKIVFSGGSSTLYGIDAKQIEKDLGVPAFNNGLMAGMRLEDLLDGDRAILKPGDTLVLLLEPAYYEMATTGWDRWRVRNAIGWNPSTLDRLPLLERIRIFLTASDIFTSYDLARAALDQFISPDRLAKREKALEPGEEVIARYLAEKESSQVFAFSYTNLDDRGDIHHTEGNRLPFAALIAKTRPSTIPPEIKQRLAAFIAEMKARSVRVYFDYTPYVLDATGPGNWQPAEAAFTRDVHDIGGEILGMRDRVFYPATYFYDGQLHLNNQGRQARTPALVQALREKLGR